MLAGVQADAQTLIGAQAAIVRSQAAYLDFTHPMANKGDGVSALCERIGVPLARTAVIGDMFNDTAMFARSGFSIAMGQAPDDVKRQADAVSRSNDRGGFAHAVDRLLSPKG